MDFLCFYFPLFCIHWLMAYNISPDFIHKPIQLKQKNLFYGTYGLHIKLAVG